MGIKNIDFGKENDYIDAENAEAEVFAKARASGVRQAKKTAAKPACTVPSRRPVSVDIPRGEDGQPDYAGLDKPAYLRHNQKDPVAPPANEPVHTLPSAKTGGVNLSDRLSEFVGKMKMNPNLKLGCVDFTMPNEDQVAFRRFPDAIAVGERAPDDSIILAMLELGKSDFGAIEVYGSPEFIANAVRVAIENGIVLQNREYAQALGASHQRMRA